MGTRLRRREAGEKPVHTMPLKMDRLPATILSEITELRRQGRTWIEIERMSPCFDWESVPRSVRVLFPGLRLPHSTLHRWFDLRVEHFKVTDLPAHVQLLIASLRGSAHLK